MTDAAKHALIDGLRNFYCYEELIAAQSGHFEWPEFDERASAALCYTSGTTGNPKGALYSHRAIVLNAMTICMPGMLCISQAETILPVVPMFHINGVVHSLCGTDRRRQAGVARSAIGWRRALYELMEDEQVTVSAGVPTVWLGLLQYVEQYDLRFSSLQASACRADRPCPSP